MVKVEWDVNARKRLLELLDGELSVQLVEAIGFFDH